MNNKLNVICVYKSGGDFTEKYVYALYNACWKYIQQDFVFYCFTDVANKVQASSPEEYTIYCVPLEHPEREGWWNKFEIFRIKGKCLYLDLDTVLVGGMERFISCIDWLTSEEFIGVKAFNPMRNRREATKFNSGVMAWNGNFSFVQEQFNYRRDSSNLKYCGDQDRISEILRNNYIDILYWQDLVPGLYSYKRHLRGRAESLPHDAAIICFHGTPRPEKVKHLVWMEENWVGYTAGVR